MMIIAPSILSADFSQLGQELEKISTAEWVHIDVMDGQFVPNISFGAPIIESIRPLSDKYFDTHLMIQEPERFIEDFAKAGSNNITIQVEASQHPHRAIQMIKKFDLDAGLAINPGTPVSLIEPLLGDLDLILVMTVNPGFGGQDFIESTVEKVKILDRLRKEKAYDYQIQVDGGINDQTGALCREAGADVLVAGSYIFKSDDPASQIEKLR